MGVLTFDALQREVRAWQLKNFPLNTDNEPFHGIVEEVGELAAFYIAMDSEATKWTEHQKIESEAKDAIADITIYLSDYCNQRHFSIAELFEVRGNYSLGFGELQAEVVSGLDSEELQFPHLVSWVGQLSHARLKSKQGIRGTKEEHLKLEKLAIQMILFCLAGICIRHVWNYEDMVSLTFEKIVRKRDWISNPLTGVAPQVMSATAGPDGHRSTNPYEVN